MRQRGLTLFELLFVIIVAATVLYAGAPALRWLLLDARRTANINAFVTAIQLARSESAKRARPIILCKTADFSACGGADVHFEQGWMVLLDNGSNPPRLLPGEEPVYSFEPMTDGTIRSNRDHYSFRPFYRRSSNGTVTFCDSRGPDDARAVIISYTGRPRTAATGPGNRALTCAN